MGTCYSTTGSGRRHRKDGDGNKDDENDRRWKSKSGRKINLKSTDLKFKFGGGGGSRSAAAEERALHQVPGRLFGNGSSSIASLYTQQGKKGTNQDAMIVWENFCSTNEAVFCGVFDGHGPYGHMVARKVRDSLPVLLSTHWTTGSDSENRKANEEEVDEEEEEEEEEKWCEELEFGNGEKERVPEKYLPLKKSILKAFRLMDMELKTHPSIDCFCSGTTAVALIKQAQDLIIGNLGDSRAVLATKDDNNGLVAVQLTVDLKPNLPREAARIQQFKGRVFALQDEPEVARVWLPNSDSPGLAMARAFGDFCLKDFGLISTPDIYYHHITEKDKFVLLASDGVWDVLSNKEAIDIVAAAPSRSTAARALVDCATRAWRLKYPTSKNDDCAVVCLFLDPKPMSIAPIEEQKEEDISSSVTQDLVNVKESSEIEPYVEPENNKPIENGVGGSKRSLAECISSTEDEEWSALEGVTRVNSLVSIPRFLSGDKRSSNSRKSVIKI